MYISKIAAQAIVEEIGEEIHEHINMMDATGVIIASTNSARIGQMHEGARRIIQEGLPELYISGDMETETTRRGINLPLVVRGEILGVVGITGEKERVMGYGKIVRRMTEIMVTDSIQKDKKRYDQRVRYRFIEEWIEKSSAGFYSRNLIDRGRHLGIDIERPYRVMVLYFRDYHKLSDTLEGQKLLEEMEASIRHEMERCGFPYLREPPRQICLIPKCSDAQMKKTAEKLSGMIRQKYDRDVAAGFDSGQGSGEDIAQGCAEAFRAASHAVTWKEPFYYYDDLNIELFINEISEAAMLEYLDKLFGRDSGERLGDYMHLIEQYFAYEGAVGKMAESLFMHKNMLQYKLKKLAEVTGKDIRRPSDAAVYYMALAFYQKLHMERTHFPDAAE